MPTQVQFSVTRGLFPSSSTRKLVYMARSIGGLRRDIHKNSGICRDAPAAPETKSVLHQFIDKGLSNIGRYAIALLDERFILQDGLCAMQRGQVGSFEELSNGYLVAP